MVSQLPLASLVPFLLVTARIGGLLLLTPIIGGRNVPLRIRAVLALTLALLVGPAHCMTERSIPQELLLGLLVRESLVGIAFGSAVRLVLMAAQGAGQLVGQLSGLGLAETLSPECDGESSALSNLFHLVALASFVAMGGHRQVVAALLDSFQWLPPGEWTLPAGIAPALVDVAAHSFQLATRLALPAVAALLSATLITGLVGRALPQINVLAVSAAGNTLLSFALLVVGLGGVGWLLQDQLDATLESLAQTWTTKSP